MLRCAPRPARAALSSFSKRFQSAKAAQAGWQQMVKESSSSIKFTASVQATSRMEETVETVEINIEVETAQRAPPSAATDSSDWQAMLQAANKIDAGVKDEAKVTVKVSAHLYQRSHESTAHPRLFCFRA